jgi:histidinol phosphatase-like enzyme (inositol monophosphatase family)
LAGGCRSSTLGGMTKHEAPSMSPRLALAVEIAREAGRHTLNYFRRAELQVDRKADKSPVTVADREAELLLRERIAAAFPEDAILGEEFPERAGTSGYRWILDPIDGTKSFIAGLPTWGTLIGLTRHGQPCYGMMHQPFTRERFFGDGGSAHWRGPAGERTLRTRRCDALGDAILSTTSPRLFEAADLGCFERVEAEARLTRFGYDCYAYCMLAAGLIDIVIETGLKPYDIVALAPIVQGAGGVVTTWSGGSPAEGGSIVASGDPRLHEKTLALLNR